MLQLSKKNISQLFGLFLMVLTLNSCSQAQEGASAEGQAAPSETTAPQGSDNDNLPLPKSVGWVNDFGNFLSDYDRKYLTEKLKAYEKESGIEVAVVTFEDYAGRGQMSFQEYLTALGNYWGVGKKNLDNGILIGLSKETRERAIVTGLGLQKVLTDELCRDILENQLVPNVRKEGGGFFDGFNNSFIRIQEILKENQ